MVGKKKAAPGEIGHNSGDPTALTDDEMHALTLQHKKKYEHALAAKKTADVSFKNVCKLLKSELGDHGLSDIKDMIAAENDEHFEDKIQAELERQARIARWLGLELGETADLFSDIGTTAPSMLERAANEGKRAGLAGELLKPPYDGGTDAYHAYVKAWHDGQAANLGMIKKKEAEEVPLIVNPDREESGVDDFDVAASGDDDIVGDENTEIEAPADNPWPDDETIEQRAALVEDTEDITSEREPAEAL